ncbi:MAG: hypothetical protein KAK00_09905 [Nanoarchaeota archaeon]|nr:hypothetical protein [Nanoarchaeota archaeon]
MDIGITFRNLNYWKSCSSSISEEDLQFIRQLNLDKIQKDHDARILISPFNLVENTEKLPKSELPEEYYGPFKFLKEKLIGGEIFGAEEIKEKIEESRK